MTARATLADDHNSQFYAAIMDEDDEVIEELLKIHGSNYIIDIPSGTQRHIFWQALSIYPLHVAAMHRKVKSMHCLLLAGADPEKRDKQGRTTLHLVITSWPRFLTSPKELSTTNIFKAVLIGLREKAEACLRLLCQHGVDVNAEATGRNKETALHIAVSYSAVSAVQILTSYSAEVNVEDSVGMTALHRAAGTLNKEIILHLIKHGADINKAMRHSGNTPLHIAVSVCATMTIQPQEEDLRCITELLKHGADPNAINSDSMTPLQEACCMGSNDLFDLLLSYGGDINKANNAGENCLFMFLNKRTTLTNCHLLGKLLGLTTPLIIYNRRGHLPSSLMLPCYSRLKDQILTLAQEPRSLKNICKAFIYLQHVRNKKEWKQILPDILYEYVFDKWDHIDQILFTSDAKKDGNASDIAPSLQS